MPAATGFEQHLIQEGILTESGLKKAQTEASAKGVSLADAATKMGMATSEAVHESLARYCEMPFLRPTKLEIAPEVIKTVPARVATHYNFVPIKIRNGAVVVAVSDPLNTHLLDDIRLVLKRRVEAVVATPEEIDKTTKTIYGLGADTVERILSDADWGHFEIESETAAGTDLGDETIDPSIIKFVNELFLEAIQADATDIHIEPFEDELRVRFRIDGVLHQIPIPSTLRGFQSAIVSRVKVMANLNIAEKRLPQDGKILVNIGEGKYDLRVSVLPTPYGETINLRILSRASIFMSLEELGFLPDDLTQLNSFIARPHGIILVTGPTGSGKTTTLYAALSKLNKLDRKTITIEDPIEYQLKGITQMQVLPQIGFDFGTGLRSMLRHDPDIMMVGEIRDYETAEMAIRASLTGHLVFSTLHTNDAAGTVTRLTDMGVEPFLIASTMIAAIAQRLVRKVCNACGAPTEAPTDLLAQMRIPEEEIKKAKFRSGPGCDECRNTGYRGRIAIAEILPFTQEVREMTIDRAATLAIKRKGKEQGMKTLRDAGWTRIKSGDTTVEEVKRVTADADLD